MTELRKRITLVVANEHAMTVIGALVDKNVIEFHMEDVLVPAKANGAKGTKTVIPGKTVMGALGAHYKVGDSITSSGAAVTVERAGFQAASADPALSALCSKGYLERTGKGRYTVLRVIPDRLPRE